MKRSRIRKKNKRLKSECAVCNSKHFLVEHHIKGRMIDNPNHSSNLCYICSNCHYEIHKGNIIVEEWCQSSQGLMLLWHYKENDSFSGRDSTVHLF